MNSLNGIYRVEKYIWCREWAGVFKRLFMFFILFIYHHNVPDLEL